MTLPGKGRLMLDADPPRAVVAQQSVSAADIDAGKLRFEPAPNENGDAYTSFTFKVSDGRAEAEQANTFAFDVVPVDDPATGNPVITGTAQVGETLTVDTSAIEDADGLRNVQFEYQWIQVDGGNETEISGADGISYQLIDLDVGKRLKVKVSFSDDEYSYEELFSAPTDVVQTAGALTLNLDAIAGDNRINIAEKAAGFTIGGETGSVGGANVTVTMGTTELTATSADANPATWSVSVPADASYITGTTVEVEVNASKAGYSAPAAITRSLTVDLTAPTAPSYSAPASLKVREAISAISPSGGIGIDQYSATGLPSGLSIDGTSGVISGTPDTADANTTSAAVTVSDAAGNTTTVSIPFPAVAKGRPGAERVPVQLVVGSVRVRGPQRHRTIRRAHLPELFRDARPCVHGAPVHGRAHPAGRGHLRDYRHGGFLGQLQRGQHHLHGDGADRRRADAEPQRHRR